MKSKSSATATQRGANEKGTEIHEEKGEEI